MAQGKHFQSKREDRKELDQSKTKVQQGKY